MEREKDGILVSKPDRSKPVLGKNKPPVFSQKQGTFTKLFCVQTGEQDISSNIF